MSKISHLKYYFWSVTLITLFSVPVSAQGIGESSLEDLLNIEIITASKFAEPLWEAPGIVTVLTSTEIEQFGATNLWEVISMIPGVQPLYTFQSAKNVVQIRGDLPTISDNHVLLLINGRAAASRHSWDGSANSILYSSFPLSLIDRIEVVRGPGSVLYGTNAFTGVINIITKSTDGSHFQAKLQGGSFGTTSAEIFATYVSGDLEFTGGLTYLKEDGWDMHFNQADGSRFEGQTHSENVGFFSTLKFKEWTLTSYVARSKFFMVNPVDDWETLYPNRFFDLGYEKSLGDKWKMQANLSLSSQDYQILPENLPSSSNIHLSSDDYLGELTFFGNVRDNTNVLFGLVGNRLTGETPLPMPIIEDYSFLWWSVYGQVEYRPMDALKLIAGAQYNNADGPDDFVPRVGGIVNFTERMGMKLLYAEAFRSPYASERFLDDGGFALGNPDLVPQTVKTADVQFFYNTDRFQVGLSYFDSRQENLIIITTNPEPESVIITDNVEGVNSSGFELEGKYIPSHNWYLSFSYTSQENENESNVEDVTLSPDSQLKAGIGYTSDFLTLGIFNNLIDSYQDNVTAFPGRAVVNPVSESVHMVSAQVAMQFSDLDYHFTDISLELRVTNLLDEELYVPEVFGGAINTIPGEGERAFQASLKFRY